MKETSSCRHCGRLILRHSVAELNMAAEALGLPLLDDDDALWWHVTIEGRHVRSCRAASYDPRRVDALGPVPFDPRWDAKHSPSAEPT